MAILLFLVIAFFYFDKLAFHYKVHANLSSDDITLEIMKKELKNERQREQVKQEMYM